MMIAPSLLAADAACYRQELFEIEKAGAQALHIDVMVGCFVPNLSFGPNIVSSLRKHTRMFFDVHLMIAHPEAYAQAFIDAGADAITMHIESGDDPEKVYARCRAANVGFGLALCPATPVEQVAPWLPCLTLLLIMSIQPGFGGQKFMPEALDRIRTARALCNAAHARCLISVDGGVNGENAPLCRAAGASMLVAGSAVFGAKDRAAAIAALQQEVHT